MSWADGSLCGFDLGSAALDYEDSGDAAPFAAELLVRAARDLVAAADGAAA